MQANEQTEASSQGPNVISPVRAARRIRTFSKHPLPSDRTPFASHLEILRRFVTHSRNGQEPIAAEKVEGEGVPVQAAQMNVRFLADTGLLRFHSKGLYVPSPDTIRFVNALSVGEDRAQPILRSILLPTWFVEVATAVLRTRPVVTEDQLVGELALAAETDRGRKGPALQVLVEYLVTSGLISRDDSGTLSLAEGSSGATVSATGPLAPAAELDSSPRAEVEGRPGVAPLRASDSGMWHIIQTEDYFLKVRSDPDIIEDLRDQLMLLTKKIDRIRAKSGTTQPAGEGTEPSAQP